MAVLKEHLAEWKIHPVTQELMAEITANMENYIAEMVNRSEPNPNRDTWIRAYVAVAKDVLGFSPEFITPEQHAEVEDVED